jgi:hypothetical protein
MGTGNGEGHLTAQRLREMQCPLCRGNKLTALTAAFVIDDPVKPRRPPIMVIPIRCETPGCGTLFFLWPHGRPEPSE